MAVSQEFVPIKDVKDGVAMLQTGDMVMVIETSAVNFGLLSANEQIAIISAFAGMLNSLSFSIQIVIRSKRLDISDYLKVLDEAYQKQQNPLLANMMIRYRKFIESIVRDNEVLDKQFFVVIGVSYLELGFTKSSTPDMKKAMTLLVPRRDHIIRQLSRIGLRATQMDDKALAELYYDIYNFDPTALPRQEKSQNSEPPVETSTASQSQPTPPPTATAAVPQTPSPALQTTEQTPSLGEAPQRIVLNANVSKPISDAPTVAPSPALGQNNGRVNTPYVVEELKDDFDTGKI